MSENEKKPGGRPTGRPHAKAEKKDTVYKRGEGLNTGKVGNVDYDERTASSKKEAGTDRASGNPLGGIGGLGGNTGTHGGYTGSHGSYPGSHSGYSGNHSGPQVNTPLGSIGGLGQGSSGPSHPSSGSGRPTKRKGISLFRIILFILILLLVMNMLGMCGGSSNESGNSGGFTEVTPTPRPTPKPTSAPQSNSASVTGGHWNPPQTSYVDASSSLSTTVANGAREKYTTLKGNGNDTVTLLVYLCGTDLESSYGMATSDLNEMAYAAHSDKVNIIVETGGTRRWKNSVVNSGTNQRWAVSDRSVVALDKNVGRRAMTDPNTLSDFIRWGAANYPADRYFLILWDHGGGSLQGYAHDELYPNGTMTVDEISKALKDGGIKFDAVGFDACLMGNLETAIAVEPYADYLIASEETEPGNGWYYTNWLTTLARNSSTPTTELGKEIIDDFISASYQYSSRDKTTLSLVDLAEFHGTIPAVFNEFSKEITSSIKGDDFKKIADARGITREFAPQTRIDQIDLIHFCKNLNTTGSAKLASSLQSCIKYNRCNNITNSYGLSIYFPYYSPSKVSGAVQVYQNIGMDSDYTDAVRSFATMSASGQVVNSYNSNTLFDLLNGGSSYSGSSTYDSSDILNLLLGGGTSSGGYAPSSYGSGYTSPGYSVYDLLGGSAGGDPAMDLFSMFIGRNHVDTSNLILTQNDWGETVLSLSQSDWDLIHDIDLNVWVDDGKGYIDMGLDKVYRFDENGSLIMEFDGTWTAINGRAASIYPLKYEFQSETNWVYEFYIPVLYNGERANILIDFDQDNIEGYVVGVQKVYEDNVVSKGFIEPAAGDTIDLLCDYYDYSGKYQDTYKLGEQMVLDDGSLVVEPVELMNDNIIYGYRLSDIYDAHMWTPMLKK